MQPDSPPEFPARWQPGGQLYSDYIRRTAVQVSKEGEDVRTRERAMGIPELLETGQQLDHFRIDEPIAESGMAAIYRATDMRDGRKVALKIPHFAMEADPALFDRFQREEAIGLALDHPNVMRIYPVDDRSRVYMAMEWVDGKLLRQVMAEEGKMPAARAIGITQSLLKALDYIHKHGVVHRDLKPENRSEEHTSELQSLRHLVCRLLLEKKKKRMPAVACKGT